ncbi:MAG: TatD family hydrolase [Lachnospiraceae bacterium]|nr:TatD family hydrolase [Lachnospiraceae bacterium]
MIFDTHAHYDDSAFDADRDEILRSLPDRGVGRVIDIAASPSGLERVKAVSESCPYVRAAYGIHPDEVGAMDAALMERLRELLASPKAVAVGEIGLDYHWNVEPHEVQQHWFREQVKLALEICKPVFVHSRAAAEDTMQLIGELYGPEGPGHAAPQKGIIHAYSYSLEQAKAYTEMGFCLGIGGVVTFKNAKKLKKVVTEIPLKHLVLETDAPYLTPEPHRGERNASFYLHEVVRTIAELKQISEEEVERVTWDNACRLTGED